MLIHCIIVLCSTLHFKDISSYLTISFISLVDSYKGHSWKSSDNLCARLETLYFTNKKICYSHWITPDWTIATKQLYSMPLVFWSWALHARMMVSSTSVKWLWLKQKTDGNREKMVTVAQPQNDSLCSVNVCFLIDNKWEHMDLHLHPNHLKLS